MNCAFYPELFEYRARIMEALGRAGYVWLADFSAVDLEHDVFGIEVLGLRERADALRVVNVAAGVVPDWRERTIYYRDTTRDPGWAVSIARRRDQVRRMSS